jgi:hypothetical protein
MHSIIYLYRFILIFPYFIIQCYFCSYCSSFGHWEFFGLNPESFDKLPW